MFEVALPWLRATDDPESPAIAIVNGMTGEEEDLLLDKKKMNDGRALNHVLLNCTESINGEKPTYEEMMGQKTVDRLALILGIRRETYGPDIHSVVTCVNPECKKSFPVDLSLDAVEMFPTPRSDFDENGGYSVLLSDGTEVRMKMLTGHGEQRMAAAPDDEKMTLALLIPLVGVTSAAGKVLPDNDKKKWLKRLGLRYRQELRDAIEDKQFGYDTRFTAKCEFCEFENKGVLEGLNGFFFLQKSPHTTQKS